MGGMQSNTNNNNEDTIHWGQIKTDDMTTSINNKYVLSRDEQNLIETLPSMFINIDTETEVNNVSRNNNLDGNELPFITQEMYNSLVDSNTRVRKQLGGANEEDFDDDSSTTSLSTSSESETDSETEVKQNKDKYQNKSKDKYQDKSKDKYKYQSKDKYQNKSKENKYQKPPKETETDKNADYESSDGEETTDNNNSDDESNQSNASNSTPEEANRRNKNKKSKSKSRYNSNRRVWANNDSVTDEVGYNNRITIETEDINMISDY